MRAILLIADKNEFKEVEIDETKGLEDYYKHLNCSCFDVQTVDFSGIQMSLFIDDEGTFKSGNIAFESDIFRSVLCGNILFLGGVGSKGETLELPKRSSLWRFKSKYKYIWYSRINLLYDIIQQ